MQLPGLGGFKMQRSGMLNPTCCEIVPRDRTAFETYTTNLHYTRNCINFLLAAGGFHRTGLSFL